MKRAHGLTLIEVAIAFLVVSILVVVGLPAYRTRVMREIVEEALNSAAPAKETIQEYVSLAGKLPVTEAVALPFVTSKYVASTSWAASGASGKVTISTRSGREGELNGKALVLMASYDARSRSVIWVCGGTPETTVPEVYLPADCRSR